MTHSYYSVFCTACERELLRASSVLAARNTPWQIGSVQREAKLCSTCEVMAGNVLPSLLAEHSDMNIACLLNGNKTVYFVAPLMVRNPELAKAGTRIAI